MSEREEDCGMSRDSGLADNTTGATRRRSGNSTMRLRYAVVGLIALIGSACTNDSSDTAEDEGADDAPVATDAPAAPAPSSAGVTCYREAGTDLTAVFLVTDDRASARTIPADGADDELVVAEGRRLDDGVWLMHARGSGDSDGDTTPTIWTRGADGLGTAGSATLDQVGCETLDHPAVNADTGADPVDLQVPDPNPVLASGSYCFADSDSHPEDDFVTLDAAANAAVTAQMSSMNEQNDGPALGRATGQFANDDTIVVEVERTLDGRTSTGWELWQISDDASTLTYLPDGYTSYAVDCS